MSHARQEVVGYAGAVNQVHFAEPFDVGQQKLRRLAAPQLFLQRRHEADAVGQVRDGIGIRPLQRTLDFGERFGVSFVDRLEQRLQRRVRDAFGEVQAFVRR